MKKYCFFILMILFFGSSTLSAQKPNDSIFQEIQPYLYDDPDKAIQATNQLIETETDQDKKVKYYLFLSKAYTAKRNSDASYKTLLKAQEILETSTDFKSKIDVLILIAIQYQQMELFGKSFEILDEVDRLCAHLNEEFALQKNTWLGKSYAIKGIIYKSQENNEIALEKFFTSIKHFENAEQTIPNINNISIVYYNIGYSYFNLNQLGEAEKYFKKSLDYAQKSNAQSLEAYAIKGLADMNMLKGNHEESIQLFENAKTKASNVGDLVLNEGIFNGLAYNYLSVGNFEKHVENNEAYKKVQFEKEQNDLESINSFIENMEAKNTADLKSNNRKHLFINILMLVFGLAVSGFLLAKILAKYKKNQLKKKKIQELIAG